MSVVEIDAGSAPRVLHCGERLISARLPIGARVVYPPAPLAPVADVDAAIADALARPAGMGPLADLLRPGMRLTIAVDDVSVPLPATRAPDVRARVIDQVTGLAARAGVDDVHVVIATGLHRRVTRAELRHIVGPRALGRLGRDRVYNHDAEDPDGMRVACADERGDPVDLNRRAAESDLVVYVNVNFVPMNGGHKSLGVGLGGYRTIARHHNPETLAATPSYMAPETSRLHAGMDRVGRAIEKRLRVFHIETVMNNRMYGPGLAFLAQNEDQLGAVERAKLRGLRAALAALPSGLARRALAAVPAAYEVIAVHAGAAEAVHAATLARCLEQYTVSVAGQADILVTGVPYISPYNVGAPMNPLLVQVMGLGYLFNMHRGTPPLRRGGTLVLCHSLREVFDRRQHASYAAFYHRVLTTTRDAEEMHRRFEPEFARDTRFIEAYRFGHAYHGVHPFYMWYWGEHARRWVGRVIVAGAREPRACERLGWEHAPTLDRALEMAREGAPNDTRVTLLHHPPALIADVA